VKRHVQVVLFCNFNVGHNRFASCNQLISKTVKSNGKFSHRTGHEGLEGE
jgi:hypothetical protein